MINFYPFAPLSRAWDPTHTHLLTSLNKYQEPQEQMQQIRILINFWWIYSKQNKVVFRLDFLVKSDKLQKSIHLKIFIELNENKSHDIATCGDPNFDVICTRHNVHPASLILFLIKKMLIQMRYFIR